MHQDFFDMLHKDHEEVEEILNSVKNADTAKSQIEQLNDEIMPHMLAEEKAFYPHLLELADSKHDAQEGVKEHNEAKSLLKNLMSMSTNDSKNWMNTFHELKNGIIHHIKNEESKIFKHARKLLNDDTMQTVMSEFQAEKQLAKDSMKTAAMR